MPLDREITISRQEPGDRNQYGEYVPGPVRRFTMWATLNDLSLTDDPRPEGQLTVALREYTVRWFDILSVTNSQQLTVQDGSVDPNLTTNRLISWSVDDIIELTGRDGNTRRRWVKLKLRYEA